jgi:hypothetical protein
MVVLPIGAAFVVLALLWWAFAVPALVKYPTDLDVTPRYEGTFTLFVDPASAVPLATPTEVPLEIERRIRAVGAESGSSRVVVEESITQRAGDLIDATQKNVYVMDRRTMQNVRDDRAYAFDPADMVDRSDTYRLNLPFHTSSGSTYAIYKNEVGTSYEMRASTTKPTTDEAGLHLHNFTGSATEVPLADAYRAELDKVVTLPESLTLDQLKPQLKALGLDVDATLAAVAPVISPEDLAALARIAAKPIPLQYVLSFEGTAAIETTTGAEVDVGASEWVGAKPVLADITALQAIVAHYPDVPAAVTAGDALAALRSAPATGLFEYEYQQTSASVADIASEVKALRNQIRLAEMYVPFGLFGVAGLSVVVGALVFMRRAGRGEIDVHTAASAYEAVAEPEPVSSGVSR